MTETQPWPTDLRVLTVRDPWALAKVVECAPVEDLSAATHGRGLSEQELALGDYTPGRFAWKLADVHAFKGPKLKGKLGLFQPTEAQRAQIFASYRKSFSPTT